MDFRQLNTFLTIADLLSFTKAAQNLDYSQSSITAQIQQLENELGTKLFERLGHHISLTLEGKKLRPYAEQIIRLANEARQTVTPPETPNGPLLVGAAESLCVTRLPRLIKAYRLRCPDVELTIKFGSAADFMDMLKNNSLDIAFVLEPDEIQGDFICAAKMPEPMAVLSSPSHPLAQKERVQPQDLRRETLILTEKSCGYRKLFDAMLARYGIEPESLIETGNVQAIKQLVMSGLGIAFLPLAAIAEECVQQQTSVLPWDGPDFPMLTQVIYHKNKWISAALNAWIELVREMGL
jgi:DNA-binding transcriptional LysR family regulator